MRIFFDRINDLIPENLREKPEVYRKAKALLWSPVILIPILVLQVYRFTSHGINLSFFVTCIAIIGIGAVPVVLVKTSSIEKTARIFPLLFFVIFPLGLLAENGLSGAPSLAGPVIILLSTFMVGPLIGGLLTLYVDLCLFFTYLLHINSYISAPNFNVLQVTVHLCLINILIYIIAFLFERMRQNAEDEMLELSKIKSKLLANMSHEIRTPINGIVGMATLLLEEQQSPKAKTMAYTIKDCTEGLLNLLNDILEFSKIDAQKIEIERTLINIVDICSNTTFLFEAQAEAKNIQMGHEIASDVPEQILGDKVKVRQVLLNLIGNAIKFTQNGKILVRVAMDLEGKNVHFSVIDSGIGINIEEQVRLFKSYSQANASTSRKFGGTGLGLAISKGLIEAMQGDIWVSSQAGKGSKFSFSIPYIPVREEDSPKIVQHKPVKDLAILIADDNPVNLLLFSGFMKKIGYNADSVKNAKEALKAFENKKYDICYFDIQMPDLDGYELTKLIRQKTKDSRYPWIVAITGNVKKEDKEKSFAAGMNAHLAKPFNKEGLIATINEMLDSANL